MTKTTNVENIALSRHKEKLIVFALDYKTKFFAKNPENDSIFLPNNLLDHQDDLINNNDFYFYRFELNRLKQITNPWKTLNFFNGKPNYYPTNPLRITNCQPSIKVRQKIKKLLDDCKQSSNARDINYDWKLKGVSDISVEFKSTIGKFIPQLATLLNQNPHQLFMNFLNKEHRYDGIIILQNNIDLIITNLKNVLKQLKINNKFVLNLVKNHHPNQNDFEFPIIYGHQPLTINNLINFYLKNKNEWLNIGKYVKHCDSCKSQSLARVLINSSVYYKLTSVIGIVDYFKNRILIEFKFVSETEEQIVNGIYQVLCYYVILKLLNQLNQCSELWNLDNNKWKSQNVNKIVLINLQTGTYWHKDVKNDLDGEFLELEKEILISIFNQQIKPQDVIKNYRAIINLYSKSKGLNWEQFINP